MKKYDSSNGIGVIEKAPDGDEVSFPFKCSTLYQSNVRYVVRVCHFDKIDHESI